MLHVATVAAGVATGTWPRDLGAGSAASRGSVFPIGLITGLLALAEYRHTHERERREEAARAYDRADANYTEFLELCLGHPDLDCYSGYDIAVQPAADGRATEVQAAQHRVMFSMLIDVFESAYVNYNCAQ